MKNTTMRTIGVVALVLFIVTIGFAAAQAAQPLDSSLIPTVVTDRPLTSVVPTSTIPSETIAPLPLITSKAQPPAQANPHQSSNSGSSDRHSNGSSTSSEHSADSDREVVKRTVRDEGDGEKKIEDKSKETHDEEKTKD
jgi:hypothetical protein